MQITDLLGGIIKITDLKAAIAQVEEFINYTYEDADTAEPSIKRFDKQRLRYWKDMPEKLLHLQNNQSKDSNHEQSSR